METAQASPVRSSRRHLLLRGESLIAPLGISVSAVLLIALAAGAWWMMLGQRDALVVVRRQRTQMLAKAMAPGLEALLAGNELSATRRLIMQARTDYGLARCRIILPDGGVIADAEPSHISVKTLPAAWPGGPIDPPPAAEANDTFSVVQPLTVPGRGRAALEIAAPLQSAALIEWEIAAGMGLISAAGLVMLLLIYRRVRSRLAPLGMIREALLALRGGENVKDALTIGGHNEPEADAWNQLIAELGQMEQRSLAELARETLGARREARSDLINACDALSQGLIILDESSHVRYANGAAAVFLQCKREALMGADVGTLIENEEVREAVKAAIDGSARQRRNIEVERRQPQGSGVFRFGIRPLRRDNGSSVLITIEDITQQCVAQASRNSFVAQATHELRTPLTNIRLYAEMAVSDGEKDAAIRAKCLNVITGESRRLERMVGEMLSVAEIEAGSLKLRYDDVRLDKLFEELSADFAAQAEEHQIQFSVELPPKLPVLHADRDKLVLAIHNLVGNAIKYTPAGGKVAVVVQAENGQLTVGVSDTGIGIEEQEQQLVFERFYRSKDPRVSKITGTGLGLALAREVVRLHGGEITLHSELNKGSTFTLMVPVKEVA